MADRSSSGLSVRGFFSSLFALIVIGGILWAFWIHFGRTPEGVIQGLVGWWDGIGTWINEHILTHF